MVVIMNMVMNDNGDNGNDTATNNDISDNGLAITFMIILDILNYKNIFYWNLITSDF